MEDFLPPPSPQKKENNCDNVFGIGPYLFEPTAKARSAAGEGENQVHPRDGADVRLVFKLSTRAFSLDKN